MRSCFSRRMLIHWLVVGLCCLAFPQSLLADSERKPVTSRDLDFREMQCPISMVDVGNKYLMVCEQQIQLVDVRQGNRRLRTITANSKGRPVPPFTVLRKGQWVFIRGFEQRDGRIFAREIYQLPGRIKGKDRQNYPFFKEVPEWRWIEVEEKSEGR